ncbi:hypothetical protein G6F40_017438 [Rhizopus arrhizus]|nr:hypothetical protein G6F40_017438 [Rhizopus arrhizus]
MREAAAEEALRTQVIEVPRQAREERGNVALRCAQQVGPRAAGVQVEGVATARDQPAQLFQRGVLAQAAVARVCPSRTT